MWLILLWIVLKPHVATRPTNEIAGSVWDLGKAAGPIWVAIAVSVAAYLIGSISQLLSELFRRTTESLRRRKIGPHRYGPGRDSNARSISNSIDLQFDRGVQKLGNPPNKLLKGYGPIEERQQNEMNNLIEQVGRAERIIEWELGLPATLLVGKEPELFTEADRLKAESQLRFAIVPPLLAIIGYVSFADSKWWSLLALPVFILWFEGHRRDLEFKSLMLSAFRQGLVRSQTVENLKEFVDNLPTIRTDGAGVISIREPEPRDT